jgi:Domain of unknown function (DUF4383)
MPVQPVAAFAGVVFLVAGVLGFVPGITTRYGDLGFAGHASGAKLFAVFQVSILQNLIHLLFGVAGLVLAKTVDGARNFLTGGGVVYLTLWALGVVGAAGWIPSNTADNWLAFGVGIAMTGLGFVAGRGTAADPPG